MSVFRYSLHDEEAPTIYLSKGKIKEMFLSHVIKMLAMYLIEGELLL